jgi:hypothetical protein
MDGIQVSLKLWKPSLKFQVKKELVNHPFIKRREDQQGCQGQILKKHTPMQLECKQSKENREIDPHRMVAKINTEDCFHDVDEPFD